MTIREARLSDIPEMHALRLSVRENALNNPSSVTHEHYLSLLTGKGRGFVCEEDGEIVGFAIADLKASNVWALFVSPQHERRGIGRSLLDQLVRVFREEGLVVVWLSTDPGTRAERFYRAAGWTATGLTDSGERRFELRLQSGNEFRSQ
jgi:ribosomal protein S18 acetylase RimI-like enzyme